MLALAAPALLALLVLETLAVLPQGPLEVPPVRRRRQRRLRHGRRRLGVPPPFALRLPERAPQVRRAHVPQAHGAQRPRRRRAQLAAQGRRPGVPRRRSHRRRERALERRGAPPVAPTVAVAVSSTAPVVEIVVQR